MKDTIVIYESGRKPRRSGYITQRLLDELGSRQAALEWLNAQDRKQTIVERELA